ncbi:multicomponent K+:H+ antiporter subunit A [Meinhardsimonia xiamenensis]|uniref:Multicomponent K+:H+ antiporter subunit A n=1 Tax=Meinhardsimonia xiamenensis TaxID=990712 RepID=A0A1G9GLK3_9RHOB|nr:monovalent cation/H+ antiporter subunit A [Meinhardsimonia xiamenensis]PRX30556.1 multisubunit potassium/proton antiporter PhaA subunit /multisubunit potassium/proton antiporter PhaB subunit [Meinhardsimonia xiamenensis]SDL01492.1 multicomponent K+:H+ antiporter subunit A [Meinhardsimonia xiamenensis]
MHSTFLFLIAALPFLGALIPGVTIRAGRTVCAAFALAPTLLALVLLGLLAPSVLAGEVITARIEWLPALGLDASLMLDGLGLLFAGMILGVGALIIIYARFYLSGDDPVGRFYTYLLLFQGAMLGIVLSDNILLMLIFWELTSLSSFLLIGYWTHLPEGRQGARMALTVTGLGGLALLAGGLLLGDIAGSYELSVILTRGEEIRSSALYLPALLLILLGAFTKSAQFPFHFWLPHAMAAPTPVSAYLHSATMVKAGVFLLARLWPVLSGTPEWFYIVATTGLVTMVVGAVIALFKNDLKALLAYSTVSHLGLLTFLLGLGTPFAAVVAVFHIINHLTFKAALFMVAGIVDHETGTRDISRLGGLARLMPVTALIALVAALSMAGLPPFNGFISKEMTLDAAAHAAWQGNGWIIPALTTVAAVFSVAYSLRLFVHVFLGPVREDYPRRPHDPVPGMWAGPALLALLVVLIGLMPSALVGDLVAIAGGAVVKGALPYYSLKLWHGVNPALVLSVIAVIGGVILLWQHGPLLRAWAAARRPEAKAIFDATVAACVAGADRVTRALHGGAISTYLAWFAAFALVLGVLAWAGGAHVPGSRPPLPIPPTVAAGFVLLIVATLGVISVHRTRFLALIMIGVIGLTVSAGFVYLSAPDLALTQISVETVTTLLLLLALNFLPRHTPAESSPAQRLRDAGIAVCAGIGVAALAYAFLTRDFSSISEYHLANSKTGGGGTNVVNVILVDFRGYDTYGEIIVLGIAGLTIYALLMSLLSGAAGRRLRNWRDTTPRSRDRHPMMMVVATRVMMPIAIMVGVYLFLRGHNQPGGGFVAGLVVAIAFLMQYMASGFLWAQERQRIEYHALIGTGVVIAGAAGVGSWLAGRPFLTSSYGYFTIPPIEEFELATAMIFDLGVFLTVLGAVMLMLYSLSRMARVAGETINIEPMDVDPSRRAADGEKEES